MGHRRVVVTGHCWTLNLADAFGLLFDDATIRPFSAWELESPQDLEVAHDALQDADLWLRIPLDGTSALDESVHPGLRVVDVPLLTFSAFHPDLVYAHTTAGGLFRGLTDYHSAIGLWAWRQGLDPATAETLFRPDVMEQLAYDQYWSPSVTEMRSSFENANLDFGAFWLRLKRCGVFMHTINHPRPEAVALIAKTVAAHLGAPASTWDVPIERYLTDHLAHIVWPVYPPVGRALGVPGCYRWRTADRQIGSLRAWLEATWSAYEGHDRGDVVCPRIDDGRYDAVLRPVVGDRRQRVGVR